MRNKNFIISILFHLVLTLAFVIVSPISAKLRDKPEIIVVRTYEMAEVSEPELPEVIPETPKPQPKLETPPEPPAPVERLRSIPDNRTEQIRPTEKIRDRGEKKEINRQEQGEMTEQRALPAVGSATMATHEEVGQRKAENEGLQQSRITDPIARVGRSAGEVDAGGSRAFPAFRAATAGTSDQVGHRGSAKEGVRQSAVQGQIGTASEYSANTVVGGGQRALTETGLSRIKLDPYYYQMVNVCLRQCVRSMFIHAGLDELEQANSKEWLKVSRAADNYFDFKFAGQWIRLNVDVNLLGNISNIDFVRVPGNGSNAESLLEDATRKLCRLLRYDDCFAKL